MFFYPTISRAKRLHIICLSNGGYDGLGEQREKELQRAARRLGASATCVNNAALQDGPHAWDPSVVAANVGPWLHAGAVVVTFDRYGASGHANHVAVYHGAAPASFARRGDGVTRDARRHCRFYALETAPHYRRYIGAFDVLCAAVRARFDPRPSVLVASLDVRGCYAALAAHASQLVWFRRLFVVFSAYTYANRLVVID
ncbi:unnamed protein product [Pelagomonas calceolata]|uniref:N-acetylglucosaminylphosphatidylinositol deacetylase n=1 Tax=Pelagomonas calceolata TaxID=35677 RepID=A0A8J2SBE2_9STRA|nr:unnamed protein product [Pelagomonas calceolata]